MFCCNFSDKVFEHFVNPRNSGSMDDADSIGTAGDPACDKGVIELFDGDWLDDIANEFEKMIDSEK